MDRASFYVSDDHVTTPKPVKTLIYVLLMQTNVSNNLLLELHLVDDTSNSFHIDLDFIPILHEPLGLHEQPNPTRCASQDCSPSSQRSPATQMHYDLTNIEDHIIGLRLLPDLPIDLRPVG